MDETQNFFPGQLFVGEYPPEASFSWFDVPNYEGLYKINNKGEIISKWGGWKVRKPQLNNAGYLYYRFYKNTIRETKFIHRIVAEIFVNNPDNKPYVNHKDGNKTNNHYSNLEWVTASENSIHATHIIKTNKVPDCSGIKRSEDFRNKLSQRMMGNCYTGKPVMQISTGKIFNSAREASLTLGYSEKYVSMVCRNIICKTNPDWMYI